MHGPAADGAADHCGSLEKNIGGSEKEEGSQTVICNPSFVNRRAQEDSNLRHPDS